MDASYRTLASSGPESTLQMPNLRLMSNFSTKCMGLGGSFGFRFCCIRGIATPLTHSITHWEKPECAYLEYGPPVRGVGCKERLYGRDLDVELIVEVVLVYL